MLSQESHILYTQISGPKLGSMILTFRVNEDANMWLLANEVLIMIILPLSNLKLLALS